MKFLLASLVLLLASAALAQTNSEAAKPTADPAIGGVPKIDGVPPGGCMPIGLTARGDLVFPMQCRELLERQRGPVTEEYRPTPDQQVHSAPVVMPQQVQTAPVITSQQVVPPEQPRVPNKKLSHLKQRKKPLPPPQVDPDFTGSTEKNDKPETSSTVLVPRIR
jgi:hypothetical protein